MLRLVSSCAGFSELTFGKGTKLTVLDPTVFQLHGVNVTLPKVKVLPPSPKECYHKTGLNPQVTMVCVVTGFYPDHVDVSWQVNDENRIEGVWTEDAARRHQDTKLFSISSLLKVNASEWQNKTTKVTCVVHFFDGNQVVLMKDAITGERPACMSKAYVCTDSSIVRGTRLACLSYGLIISKSLLYGLFVSIAVWQFKVTAQRDEGHSAG